MKAVHQFEIANTAIREDIIPIAIKKKGKNTMDIECYRTSEKKAEVVTFVFQDEEHKRVCLKRARRKLLSIHNQFA